MNGRMNIRIFIRGEVLKYIIFSLEYHDAFASNAMALSGLVLYPFPKRKKKTISLPPKRRNQESHEELDIKKSKVKHLQAMIRQNVGTKMSKLSNKAGKSKKDGNIKRSVDTVGDWYNEGEHSPV